MRVVVAPDKFKGSLSAPEAARAMARGRGGGARRGDRPGADGRRRRRDGRGLVAATGGSSPRPTWPARSAGLSGRGSGCSATARRPSSRWRRRRAWCCAARPPRSVADLDPGDRRADPGGDRGRARRVILGIGGSADQRRRRGAGQALGYRLLDAGGREIGPGGGALDASQDRRRRARPAARRRRGGRRLRRGQPALRPARRLRRLRAAEGRRPREVAVLDRNLDHLARVVERDLGQSIRDLPGAGAAGGLGGGWSPSPRGGSSRVSRWSSRRRPRRRLGTPTSA